MAGAIGRSQALFDRAGNARAKAQQAMDHMTVALERATELAKSEGASITRTRVADLNQLVGNLTRKLESQPVIEEAKGIIMARSHVSPDEAFDVLRRASMRMNRKLRDLAADLVNDTVRHPASH